MIVTTRLKTISVAVLTALTVTSFSLYAAPPRIGDALRQVQPPKELSSPEQVPLVEMSGVQKDYRPELIDDKNQKKILVQRFSIEGNQHVDSVILLALLESYENKTLSFNDMRIAASLITKYYRAQGYIVARAYVPVQDMNDGVLELVVIEGKYGELNLQNNSDVSTTLVQGFLDPIKDDAVINNRSLERSLLLVNALPGVMVSSADIKPGKDVGSSDFLIITENSKPYDGYVLADSYGERSTGRTRLMAGLNLYAPLNIGDQLSLFGLISEQGGIKSGSVNYSLPINQHGIRAQIGYLKTSYQLGDTLNALDAGGDSESYQAILSYPAIMQRSENLMLSLKLEKNYLTEDIASVNLRTDKNILAFRLAADYEKLDLRLFGLNQSLNAHVVLTHGSLDIEDATQRALDEAGAKSHGSYEKIAFGIEHSAILSPQWKFDTIFKFQHSLGGKSLDGSEYFSVGGFYGVKAFPFSELSAENGYLLTLEASYQLPVISGLLHRVGVFYDRGKADRENPGILFEQRTLQDIGLSYYANYDDFFAKVHAAWQVGSEEVTSDSEGDFRFLAMVGWLF